MNSAKLKRLLLCLKWYKDFVRDLDRSDNTTSWSMCYTDPTNEDLPFSNSPLIPHTPSYVCQDGRGSMLTLERNSFLNGLFVLFICLSIGTLAFAALRLITRTKIFWKLGRKKTSAKFPGRRLAVSSQYRHPIFSTNHTYLFMQPLEGLLSSDFVLGQQAFTRLKWVVFVGTVIFFYAVWPNLLVQSILIPTSSIASLGVSSSETFGYNLPCRPNIPPGPVPPLWSVQDFTVSAAHCTAAFAP